MKIFNKPKQLSEFNGSMLYVDLLSMDLLTRTKGNVAFLLRLQSKLLTFFSLQWRQTTGKSSKEWDLVPKTLLKQPHYAHPAWLRANQSLFLQLCGISIPAEAGYSLSVLNGWKPGCGQAHRSKHLVKWSQLMSVLGRFFTPESRIKLGAHALVSRMLQVDLCNFAVSVLPGRWRV